MSIPRGRERVQVIASELRRLFQRRIEMTKQEAFQGLNPQEWQEHEQIETRISELFREMARVRTGG